MQVFPFNVEVGADVAIANTYGSGSYIFGYSISKVTPTGQIVIKNTEGDERRFNKDNRQISGNVSKFYPFYLVDAEKARAYVNMEKGKRRAAAAIMNVRIAECKHTYSKDTMLKHIEMLEAKLAEAKAAVEATIEPEYTGSM